MAFSEMTGEQPEEQTTVEEPQAAEAEPLSE